MFDWFRKKAREPAKPHADGAAMLALSNPAFVDLCVKMIRGDQPGANAMVVVAFDLLRVTLPLGAHALKLEGKNNSPDDVFRTLFDHCMSGTNDVVNQRRHGAFLRALLFHDLMRREESDPTLHAAVVGIWVELASSGRFIRNLLEHNIVWSDVEKSPFRDFKTDDDVVSYIVNSIVPARYRSHRTFQELGKKHNFFVLP
jgi:hypothetical protein